MAHGSRRLTTKKTTTTLAFRMLAAFTAVILISAVVLVVVVDRIILNTARAERGEQQTRDAEALTSQLNADLSNRFVGLAARSNNMHSLGFTSNPPGLQRLLGAIQQSMPDYLWVGFIGQTGQILSSTDALLNGSDVSDRPWFKGGLTKPTFIDFHTAALLTQSVLSRDGAPLQLINLSLPVRSAAGDVVGVLVAYLSQQWLESQVAQHFDGQHHVQRAQHTLIGRDGAMRIGDTISDSMVSAILQDGRPRGWITYRSPDKASWMVSFAQHRRLRAAEHPLDWISVVQVPMDSVDEGVEIIRGAAFSSIAAISLIAWLTLWWLIRTASDPINNLMRDIERVRRERTAITPQSGLPREFEQVQHSMNELIESIRAHSAWRKQAMEDLRKSFQGVTESFPGVLFSARLTAEGKRVFTYLSPSAELYLGLPLRNLPVETAALYPNIVPETRATLAAAINEQARSGDAIDVMVSIKGGDGQVRTMRAKAKKRRISDSEWIWDGMMVDVSDLLEAQQRAAAGDVTKSDFLASMSHEIRTPLNGILGFAQLLVHTVQDPAQKADARRIIETAEMLTVILNDVLDYSKIEAGELTLESYPFDVAELLDSCVTLFNLDTQKRGIRFTVRNECPPALRLVGDPTRLRQIITNLLSNAVKFTEEGSVDLRVTAESTTAEQVSLAVTVTDTGRGMSAEQQERLFQRFDQVDRAIYRQYGGSGLGLAITKRLLRAMGGDISVTSAPGQGSSFRFGLTLPVANTPVGDTPTPDQRSTEPLDILVVDDVAINRELLRRILGRDGHRVTEAASGEYAIEAASQRRFDLILMDIEMPGMDGLEACRKLRSGDGPNRATYVVALTGYAFDADVQKAMDAGMDAHMAKPIMMQALRAQIEKYRASRLT